MLHKDRVADWINERPLNEVPWHLALAPSNLGFRWRWGARFFARPRALPERLSIPPASTIANTCTIQECAGSMALTVLPLAAVGSVRGCDFCEAARRTTLRECRRVNVRGFKDTLRTKLGVFSNVLRPLRAACKSNHVMYVRTYDCTHACMHACICTSAQYARVPGGSRAL